MLLFFRLNDVAAANFPVHLRLHHYFSGWTPLTPLFFLFNGVNAATFQVERR